MAYVLEAVIGPAPVVSIAEHYWASATVVALRRGLGIVPMTGDLFDEVSDGSLEGPPEFWRFPGGFGRALCDWSSHGRVAYAEAEYFLRGGGRDDFDAAGLGRHRRTEDWR